MDKKPGIVGILNNCIDWEEFKSQLSFLNEKQKGNAFETLTKFSLQLDPKYKTQLKSVWNLSEVIPKVRKDQNLPVPDEGIDLVAESKNGEFCAIQCKYREAGEGTLL